MEGVREADFRYRRCRNHAARMSQGQNIPESRRAAQPNWDKFDAIAETVQFTDHLARFGDKDPKRLVRLAAHFSRVRRETLELRKPTSEPATLVRQLRAARRTLTFVHSVHKLTA
jgi:hypothetical protein